MVGSLSWHLTARRFN